jgi:large exoprotein involved in heme utilization and adhesion
LLRASGSANLFLINPSGIIFGPNAQLNIGGSFVASTAGAVTFAGGTQFSANPTGAPPLLTVSVPVGLQYNTTAAGISVQSSNLAVAPGKTLALIGGDLTLSGGSLRAPAGRIELGSVAGSGLVSLNSTPLGGWALGYQGVRNFQDIQLNRGASADTSGPGGGDIQVRARSFRLSEGARIVGLTLGDSPGGTLAINATESVELIGTGTYAEDILRFLTVKVTPANLPSGLFTLSFGSGAAGNLTINTPKFVARNGAFVATSTLGQGSGGNLTVSASDTLDLTASALITGTGSAGNAGNLTIDTGAFIARENAVVGTASVSLGRAGEIAVSAKDSVELLGTNPIPVPTTDGLFTGFFSVTPAGSGGNISLATRRLVVSDGAGISAGSLAGTGGNITVTATDTVEIIGKSPNGKQPSSLSANIEAVAERGGNLTVRTSRLILRDGGTIAVRSRGTGDAGNIEIAADSIRLENQGLIAATSSVSGEGGNIQLSAQSLLLRNSTISAEAGTASGVGNGGNLTAETGTLVALEGSHISANAFQGNGGNINITTQGIFLSADSDITASSQLGISGQVKINTPDLDRIKGLVVSPGQAINVEGLVTTGCSAGGHASSSQFIVTGRGGLPPNPEGTLSNEPVLADLRTVPVPSDSNLSDAGFSTPLTQPSSAKIVEATGWAVNSEDKIVLTASAPNVTPKSPWLAPPHCQRR